MSTSEAADRVAEYIRAASDPRVQYMHLAGEGPVRELESKLRAFYGMRYALCVSNATTGLLLVALALCLRREEFITTPLTWGGSLAGWLLLENRPRFADIDPMTLTLDPECVRKAITRRTKAVLAVDLFGVPCDMEALRKVCDDHGLWYVADAAQSFGATYKGRPASSDADVLVTSLGPGKALFAGEGGAILTNNRDIYERLLWHGQHPLRHRHELGLGIDNQFALTTRFNPLGAICAASLFESSLARLCAWQGLCLDLIDCLAIAGLIVHPSYSERGLRPNFHPLTAQLARHNRNRDLPTVLRTAAAVAELIPLALRPFRGLPTAAKRGIRTVGTATIASRVPLRRRVQVIVHPGAARASLCGVAEPGSAATPSAVALARWPSSQPSAPGANTN